MKYILDTNIIIYALKNKYPSIKANISKCKPNDIAIPSIVKAELLLGAYKSIYKDETLNKILLFIAPFNLIAFGDIEADIYSKIRADLELNGEPIGPNDYLVASTAIANNLTLITNNTKEFSRIKDLKIENWSI